jgi:hypothetical protein
VSRSTVAGFDYVADKAVAWTTSQWRQQYPTPEYKRRVENGETFYTRAWNGQGPKPTLAAEAYAIIPAGRAP